MLFVSIIHLFHDYDKYLIISHLYKKYSFQTESQTTTPSSLSLILKPIDLLIAISIELNIIFSPTQLSCQLLLPPKYTIYLHYSPRCSNIHIIDKLRPLLFLRCIYNYLWRQHSIHLLIYYASIYSRPFPWNLTSCLLSSLLPTCSTTTNT
jgi:hypothetical protein